MTRLDEIKKKMLELEEETPNWKDTTVYVAGFLDGAMWADAHPHWISVEDELPPLGLSMFVVTSYGEATQISVWGNGLFREPKLGAIIHPNYWMPLPQAPKEGGEE